MKLNHYMFKKDWLLFKNGVIFEFYNNQNISDIIDKLPKNTGDYYEFMNITDVKTNSSSKPVEDSEGELKLKITNCSDFENLTEYLSHKFNISSSSSDDNTITLNYNLDDVALRAYSKLTPEQIDALKTSILKELEKNEK